jgi:hypothetical protein
LASKATPGPWGADHVQGGAAVLCIPPPGVIVAWRKDERAGDDVQHIAFNDPETALLEAEVIAAARDLSLAILNKEHETWEDEMAGAYPLVEALRALDAHHAKREGK